ncbi:MAG TPA: BrnA antitoxin family protein [Rhizobiaceae bacterium]|nr:BrnA antitoxin family protein [Rhizobiaceae bacterium]
MTADALNDDDNPPADDLIRRRGRPLSANPKQAIKLRIDPDVVEHFKAEGPGWQSRMNKALRRAAGL